MCGIAGRLNGAENSVVDPLALARMAESMAHRGPDGEGFHLDGRVGLCHRRLAIVDRQGGAQPLQNEDGTVWVVFNGEIYNHEALRAELRADGHVFRTRSDTEAIVHGYEQWGDEVTSHLLGMFAFALWDARSRSLLLARDRLGIKPLYYARVGEDLVFGSEIKALLRQPDVPREDDPDGLVSYLQHRYVPGPRTAFRGIFKLPPGHRLRVQGTRFELTRYWSVPAAVATHTEAGGEARELLALFTNAVELRLMGEVPVGLFLSGGLDSSAVAWAMARAKQGAPVKSYSVGFPGEGEGGELFYARLAAQALGTEHHEVVLAPEAFEAFLPRLVWHLDEPVADSACVPLFYLAEAARSEVTVALSGEGADEILAGYPIYWKMGALERLHGVCGRVGVDLLRRAAGRVRDPKLAKYLRWASLPLERRYRGVSMALGPAERRGLLGRDGESADNEAAWEAIFAACEDRTPLSRLLYADTLTWLPDDLLVKADKMTMASGLELRVPFLDHRLVEFATALPDRLKLRGRTGKWLLREALREKLPKQILTRPKRGFPVPFSAWLRGPLHDLLRDRLLSAHSVCKSFDQPYLNRLLDDHRSGRRDHGEALFALLVYELWHDRFIRDPQWRQPWPTPSAKRKNPPRPATGRSVVETSSASPTTGTASPSPRPT